jgi:serine/threonine protein kinase/formylglycine-generating enzyme required for sulfatase activity
MKHQAKRAREIFLELLDLGPSDRSARMEELCGGDAALRGEVTELLDAHGDSVGFLEKPILPPGEASGDRPPALSPGDQVGPYHLREILGEGGMGVVFLAEQHAPLERRVALKVIKPGMDSRSVVARFETERQALALMKHPGIARVHDAGTTEGGYPYFVMEYVNGRPLLAYCDERRHSVRRRIEFFLEVCEAIRHAHQKGILHRDLKPTNLLVTEESGRPAVKVIDFGVAKAMSGTLDEEDPLTLLGTVVGTPEYMSPEQADAAESAIDTRSDTYSLGVVLFELLTGTLPIPLRESAQEGISAMRRRIAEEVPETASRRVIASDDRAEQHAGRRGVSAEALSAQLRGDLEWILGKALEKNPEDRYPSVSEFAADLRRHLDDEPVLAAPPTGIYRARKFVVRHRGTVLTSSIVLLALVVGLVVSLRALLRAWKAEDDFLLLSIELLIERGQLAAEELPFATPADGGELDRLAGELESMLVHLPALTEQLEELGERGTLDETGAWRFEENSDEWWHQNLSRCVERLEDLASDDPARSALVALRERRVFAADSLRTSTEAYPELWSDAIRSIGEHPAYDQLQLSPQIGLVPLEADGETGLWEFWHPLSGERPVRGADGAWEIAEETGLIFVLIPAGEFLMGAEPPELWEEEGVGNLDLLARAIEGPVHAVAIGKPFFLSRYEMTQGQWSRIDFINPSGARPGSLIVQEGVFDLRHPVESVSWRRTIGLLRRIGLTLPTEAQWEYAARAGAESAFLCGPDFHCLEEYANVNDQRLVRSDLAPALGSLAVPWDDGWPVHAPVGSFAPNDFGLHDVHGNVWEWVLDPFGEYRNPTDPEDGYRLNENPDESAVARGGSCLWSPAVARLSWRNFAGRGITHYEIGLRPARSIRE